MRRFVSVVVLSLAVSGCAANKKPPETVYPPNAAAMGTPECPYTGYMKDSKWIPEAQTYIDYSTTNFYSWHYNGRERDATPEEIIVYELGFMEKLAQRAGDYDREYALGKTVAQLKTKYAPLFEELSKADEARFHVRVQELAKANGHDDAVASDKPKLDPKGVMSKP